MMIVIFLKTSFQVTLYFKKEHFKTSIPVAITSMLVMYTLNNSISAKLPQTSQIKFIDIWIIYGLFLHFLILILLVMVEHLPGEENLFFPELAKSGEQSEQTISPQGTAKLFAQKVLPVLEILFTISYTICAFMIHCKII